MMFEVGFPTMILMIGLLMALIGIVIWELMKHPVIASPFMDAIPVHACSHCGTGLQLEQILCLRCGTSVYPDQKVSVI